MSTTTIALEVLGLSAVETTASAAALAERDRLLSLARKGKVVTDAASVQRATDVLKEVKAFTRTIEFTRKEVKEPVLQLGKDIDGLARTLTEDLEREASRISALVGEWQAEQNRIADEARRKAWEEEQRIRREAEAREIAEPPKDEAEGMKRDEETALAIGKAHAAAAVIQAAKPQGVAARRNVEFEVTDIVALYEAVPVLVNLTPNTAAIKAALKQLPEGKTIPGIRHWFTTAAIVR